MRPWRVAATATPSRPRPRTRPSRRSPRSGPRCTRTRRPGTTPRWPPSKKAEDAKAAADLRADEQKTTFDKDVAALNKQMKDKIAAMDDGVPAPEDRGRQEGRSTSRRSRTPGPRRRPSWRRSWQDRAERTEVLEGAAATAPANEDRSDFWTGSRTCDLAKLAERMGKVIDKTGTFVNVRFAHRIDPGPGQTFVVIPPTGSLVEVIEREKALEKRHHEFTSLGRPRARSPTTR